MPVAFRRGQQSLSGLVGFLTVVAAGCVIIAAAVTWLSGPWAAGIGAAVTAVYGLTADVLRPRRRTPEETDLLRDARGRIPLVCRVTGPEAAGVRAAEGDAAPPYILRDAEHDVLEKLRANPFVLLVGDSAAGKSRLAFEVARSRFPRHRFVVPRTRAAVHQAVALASSYRRAVLWLDDLEDYLGRDGVTLSLLRSFCSDDSRRRVVLGTMRVEEYRRYEAREESRLTGSDRDVWRAQREVLQGAGVVRLARRWTPQECRRAAAHTDDARIAAALRTCDRFGIAETIAAGPELTVAWENAWAPGANPRAAAVITAAVDCRRAGLRSALTAELLEALHTPYLAERGGTDLRPEAFTEALLWASAPALATSALLVRDSDDRYKAFDYLLNVPSLAPVPDHLWNQLIRAVTPEDAYDLGLVAHQQARLQRAVTALKRAEEGHIAEAEFPLALALGDAGRPSEAVARLQRIADRSDTDPLFALAARHQTAFFTGEVGQTQRAVHMFRSVVSEAQGLLPEAHPDLLDARGQLAYFTGETGNTRSAASQFRQLLTDRRTHHPLDHQQIIATQRSCIWFSSTPENLAASEERMAALLDEAVTKLGGDDPHTLAIRASLAAFAARAGRYEESLALFASLVEDRTRLLEPEHPHVIRSRLDWAQVLADAGQVIQARSAIHSTLDTAVGVLEPGHRHLRYARTLLRRLA